MWPQQGPETQLDFRPASAALLGQASGVHSIPLPQGLLGRPCTGEPSSTENKKSGRVPFLRHSQSGLKRDKY